jgi:hypothetical protein
MTSEDSVASGNSKLNATNQQLPMDSIWFRVGDQLGSRLLLAFTVPTWTGRGE